jgi:hypothetical protein
MNPNLNMEKQLYLYMQSVLIDFDNEVEIRKLVDTVDKKRKKAVTPTKNK